MAKRLTALLAVFLLGVSVTACGSGTTASSAPAATPVPSVAAPSTPASVAPSPSAAAVTCDSFTILNHRTDLDASGDWKKLYVDPFAAKYPGIKEIKTESITDYHNIVKTRLAGGDYGDVLVIPNGVNAADYSTYFAPLGAVSDLTTKYRFIQELGSFEGQVYGIAINGNANGILYNKDVFTKAGITTWPTTPDEFIADLQAIKAKVPGVDPLYTNYKAGWPMSQWQPYSVVAVSNPDFSAQEAHDASPWDPGKGQYITDALLYNVVKAGLNEKDPTTTDWEPSKDLVASGKIGVMALGSWAISQMQGRAKVAGIDPANIGYMPFPMQVNGKFQATVGGDLRLAINKNTKCMEAAKAWVSYFIDDSGYAANEAGVPTALTGAPPAWFKDFQDKGVNLFAENAAPKGEEGLRDKIANDAKIDIWGNVYRQAIIDDARGQTHDGMDKIFANLNKAWADAKTADGG
jgi:raffinose/stachyose/melibiose transport system substrate-binding protein